MTPAQTSPAITEARPIPTITRATLSTICGLFFLSRLLFLGTAALSHTMIAPGPYAAPAHSWVERFNLWDASWYVAIAESGYQYDPHGQSNVAFYPLYPMLIRALHACGLDVLLAGYLISHIALFAAALQCWRLAALETRSVPTANLAVTFLLLGPGAVWFGLIYTESLFLLAFVACLLAARRKRWLEAGLWGYIAALTRTPGLFLSGFLVLEAAQQWRESTANSSVSLCSGSVSQHPRRSILLAAIGACGPICGQLTFLIFLQVTLGDWQAQQRTMTAGWLTTGPRLPWTALLKNWRFNEPIVVWPADLLLAVVIVAGVACFWTMRRWGYPMLIFSLAFLYLASTSGDSLTRYLSTLAPVYIVLAQAAQFSRLVETTILSFALTIFIVLTVFLVNGYHIT